MKKAQILKDGARALSLANLCFIITWTELLGPGKTFWPEMPRLYSVNAFLSVILSVLLLASLVFVGISLARRSRNPLAMKVARLAFPLTLLLPLNGFIRMLFPAQINILQIIVLILAVPIIALSDIAPWDRIILRVSAIVVLVLFPFVLFTFSQALWSMRRFSSKPLAAPITGGNKSRLRVLWLLFDEMDQQVTFSHRPASMDLFELDRLRSEAFYATNAYPPADATLISMPALITGRLASEVRPVDPSELMITYADEKKAVKFSSQPNLFSQARKSGFNTAIIGYYLPYCRLISSSLTHCRHHEIAPVTLRQSMFSGAVRLIESIPLGPTLASFFPGLSDAKAWKRNERRSQLDAYLGILDDAKEAAVDPTLGLVLVHWPVPHTPNIYSRRNNSFELDSESSYLDNLALADKALGEVRRVMEHAGMWEDTIVLVTSDHWERTEVWRSSVFWSGEDEKTLAGHVDHRVPFVLKLAGQKQGVTYQSEFNNILTHDLLLALLKNEISSPESVMNWLDRNRNIGESPYRFMMGTPSSDQPKSQ